MNPILAEREAVKRAATAEAADERKQFMARLERIEQQQAQIRDESRRDMARIMERLDAHDRALGTGMVGNADRHRMPHHDGGRLH